MLWEEQTQIKFAAMIAKVPIFLRDIAKEKISKKALQFAQDANLQIIGEKEMVDAFFAETPFGFHGPMKSDMQELGIPYTQYGHPQ